MYNLLGTKIEVGTEFKVGTKIKKYGISINAKINVVVNYFLPDKCCNKISLGLVFPKVGFFQGHIDQISVVLWVYQSVVFYVYFRCYRLSFFSVSASWLLVFMHVKYFYLMTVKV